MTALFSAHCENGKVAAENAHCEKRWDDRCTNYNNIMAAKVLGGMEPKFGCQTLP